MRRLLWMGGDPVLAARQLGETIYHIHAKDVRIEKGTAVNKYTKLLKETMVRELSY